MKITVNYISNVFLAVILAVIPYTALIKLFIKNNDTPFLNVEMVLIIILNIIVYISAVTGLETAENKAKENGIKTHLSAALFILMVLPVILKLIIYTIILLTAFFKYSHKAGYFLTPLLIYHIYSAFQYTG